MNIKAIAMTGVMSLAGLGLVGTGAHAIFTTATSSNQTVTAGTVNVVFWSSDANAGCTTQALAVANDCTSITLPTVGPVGSTFDTPASTVNEINTGSLPAAEASVQVTDTVNNNAGYYLQDEMNMCIGSDGAAVANGPLTTAMALTPTVTLDGSLATGYAVLGANQANGDSFTVDFYAGQNSTICGDVYSVGSITSGIWRGYEGGAYTMPAALTSAAQGASVTVTVTNSATN